MENTDRAKTVQKPCSHGIEAAFKLLAQLHTGGLLDKAGKDFLEDVLRFFSVKM